MAAVQIHLPEHPSDEAGAGRLGRHVHHDPASRAYPVRALLPPAAPRRRPWWRRGAFNQGDTASCTFQTQAGILLSFPYRRHTRPHHGALADPAFRLRGYAETQRHDPWPGAEPDYYGSDGLSSCKAAQALGLVPATWQYRWCFDVADYLDCLDRLGPIGLGTNWYEAFDRPTSRGELVIGGDVRGGHEVELLWHDADDGEVVGVNSWGPGWGPMRGRFRIKVHPTLERLVAEQADAFTWVTAA